MITPERLKELTEEGDDIGHEVRHADGDTYLLLGTIKIKVGEEWIPHVMYMSEVGDAWYGRRQEEFCERFTEVE